MNALVSISYEDRLKAEIRARRARLGFGVQQSKPKPPPPPPAPEKPKYDWRYYQRNRSRIRIKPHDAHIRAWAAWRAMFGLANDPRACLAGLCIIAGVTEDQIRCKNRDTWIVMYRMSIARTLMKQFPELGLTGVARLMRRDRSTVAPYVGLAKDLVCSPFKHPARKVSGSRVPVETMKEIVFRYRKGEAPEDLAKIYGVSANTVFNYNRRAREGKAPWK